MDTSAIYIHGIGKHPKAEIWKSQWDLALFGRPLEGQTKGAYWADILHGDEGNESFPKGSNGEHLSASEFLRYTELASDPDAREFVHCLRRRFELYEEEEDNSFSKRVFPGPNKLRGRVAKFFLEAFVTDAASYFFVGEIRDKIKRRLSEKLNDLDSPCVLVSHSLGTVVAYDVLREMTHGQREKIALFVTLGSPLGIREVQHILIEQLGSLEVPSGIAAWHNFADRLDPVALDNRLANDFEALSSSAAEIQDHTIINRSILDFANFNPHDSAGYLSNPEVRSLVHQAMQFDTTGRFVIARDVAHGFAARNARQPVLIEALQENYPAVDETEREMKKREARQQGRSKRMKSLSGRIRHLSREVKSVVEELADADKSEDAIAAARILRLRKYVSAHLTPIEIQTLAISHRELNIYAMWRSAKKAKFINRSHRAIGADAARAGFNSLGQGITWAVLDTGCRFDHPHFQVDKNRKIKDYSDSLVIDVLDCTTKSDKPESILKGEDSDPDGHGSHVCGIISGKGCVDQTKYEGIAPLTKLLVYKVLNEHGEGEDAWIIKAIDDIFYRNENNSHLAVHGVNLSLGGPFDPTVYGCGFSPICKELRDIWRQGTLVCVAAGNEGQISLSTSSGPFTLNTSHSIGDPANLEDCIAVGSVNTDKPYLYGISYFSSRGPTTDGRIKPDVVAPGERISSCTNNLENRLYRESSGTSMACPHISGLLAAFLSVRREFIGRPDEVKRILLSNCNDLGRDKRLQGHGIPNLLKMLTET